MQATFTVNETERGFIMAKGSLLKLNAKATAIFAELSNDQKSEIVNMIVLGEKSPEEITAHVLSLESKDVKIASILTKQSERLARVLVKANISVDEYNAYIAKVNAKK